MAGKKSCAVVGVQCGTQVTGTGEVGSEGRVHPLEGGRRLLVGGSEGGTRPNNLKLAEKVIRAHHDWHFRCISRDTRSSGLRKTSAM